jgi:uncharacterized membrane protein HdeD (DUF308 family)
MTILPTLFLALGLLLFVGSFGFRRPNSSLARAWGIAMAALGLLAFDLWALRTDLDNFDHGPRLGRAMVPSVLAFAAIVWAVIRTIQWTRIRRAGRGTARAAV